MSHTYCVEHLALMLWLRSFPLVAPERKEAR
jgi:hypothetical protein